MTEVLSWRDAVKVVRATFLTQSMQGPGGSGRATVFDFAGVGGKQTWIGSVVLQPGGITGAHHHGRHEVAIYIAKGTVEIRWGDKLEFAANVGPGDFVYFTPGVPHQERNLSDSEAVDFVVVRSDNERIAVGLDCTPAEDPEVFR
jgi:uncharacterized RmlC-like cupin family protein